MSVLLKRNAETVWWCRGVVVKSLAVVWQPENASVGDSTPKLQCGFCSTSMVD
jgi:hypothetical protein